MIRLVFIDSYIAAQNEMVSGVRYKVKGKRMELGIKINSRLSITLYLQP